MLKQQLDKIERAYYYAEFKVTDSSNGNSKDTSYGNGLSSQTHLEIAAFRHLKFTRVGKVRGRNGAQKLAPEYHWHVFNPHQGSQPVTASSPPDINIDSATTSSGVAFRAFCRRIVSAKLFQLQRRQKERSSEASRLSCKGLASLEITDTAEKEKKKWLEIINGPTVPGSKEFLRYKEGIGCTAEATTVDETVS